MANLSNLNNKFLVTTGGNVLINKTAANNATVGTQIMSTGDVNATVSGDTVARFNRLSSDGEIIRIQKDTSTVGYIGSNAAGGNPVLDIGSDSSGNSLMRFLTSGSERMRIEATGVVKFPNTATSTGDVGTIAHYTNNYMYIKGGTGGLAIGDDGFGVSIYLNNIRN